jgi:hypothetical protein
VNVELYLQLINKEEKSNVEWELLKVYKTMSMISEILVEESKLHISSEDAIIDIRNCMNQNQ